MRKNKAMEQYTEGLLMVDSNNPVVDILKFKPYLYEEFQSDSMIEGILEGEYKINKKNNFVSYDTLFSFLNTYLNDSLLFHIVQTTYRGGSKNADVWDVILFNRTELIQDTYKIEV